mmetsp:Transcript_15984/g.37683  ORF Transcript_15984/g.37683 Transcript_15984/m.37683 type:complete len:924 (+) Transcript_15984:136-2907(+)
MVAPVPAQQDATPPNAGVEHAQSKTSASSWHVKRWSTGDSSNKVNGGSLRRTHSSTSAEYDLRLPWRGQIGHHASSTGGGQSDDPPRFGCRQAEFNVTEAMEDSEDVLPSRPWGHRFVIHDANPFRTAWNFLVSILLIYTATIFPYWICFLDFRIELDGEGSLGQTTGWQVMNSVVDALFWVDLVLNFFFSYEDRREPGVEVEDLGRIVCHYLRGYFVLNLIACIPPEVLGEVVGLLMGDSGNNSFGKLSRVSRVHRVGRLARLARFAKLVHGCPAITESDMWIWLQNQRGVRIVNFVVGLFLVVHLMGCGWYLCAALHNQDEYQFTWVAQREAGGGPLLERGPADQWLHSMYFILTVFSTVGFGDMSATTNGEIIYVIVTMLLGSVVHGIIMSEVINVVTKMDDKAAALSEQKELLSAFAQHTDLDEHTTAEFKQWITRPQKTSKRRYDREAMRKLLVAGHLPRNLIQDLAVHIFRGSLLQNKFLQVCIDWAPDGALPPRFPLLLALVSNQHVFQPSEVVYQLHDHPFNIFLVLSGTFASIGIPGPKGGTDCMITVSPSNVGTQSGVMRSLVALPARMMQQAHPRPKPRVRSSVRGMKQLSAGASSQGTSVPQHKVYPYQLHGAGTYFGDYEILVDPLHKGLNRSRCSTVRCESSPGQVLVVTSADVLQLAADFPHYGTAWRTGAIRREATRQHLLSEHLLSDLKHKVDYKHLAAFQLQRYFRARKWAKDAGLSSGAWTGRKCADVLASLRITAEQRGLTASATLGDLSALEHHRSAPQQKVGSPGGPMQSEENKLLQQQVLMPHQVPHPVQPVINHVTAAHSGREPLFVPYSSTRRVLSGPLQAPPLAPGNQADNEETRKEVSHEIQKAKEELRAEIRSGLAEIRNLVAAVSQAAQRPRTPIVSSEDLHELSLPGDSQGHV